MYMNTPAHQIDHHRVSPLHYPEADQHHELDQHCAGHDDPQPDRGEVLIVICVCVGGSPEIYVNVIISQSFQYPTWHRCSNSFRRSGSTSSASGACADCFFKSAKYTPWALRIKASTSFAHSTCRSLNSLSILK